MKRYLNHPYNKESAIRLLHYYYDSFCDEIDNYHQERKKHIIADPHMINYCYQQIIKYLQWIHYYKNMEG